MQVGFIGLGRMGSGMAANLLIAGHDVVVFNRSPGPIHSLIDLGASAATHVADTCRGEAVITMLANDLALEQIALAEDGIVASLPAGAVHISMSTISPALSKRLARLHSQSGQDFISAPVFGRPEAAAAASLYIVAAGDAGTIDRCRPLFDAMGQETLNVGAEPSAANLVKLGVNFLFASAIEALGEAIALVGKAGIDRQAFVDVLSSTVLTAPAYKLYGGLIARSKFEPAGFAAALGHKDIRLVLAAAEDLRVPMPLASLLHDRFLRLLAEGGESLDWSAIGGLATQDATDAHPLSERP